MCTVTFLPTNNGALITSSRDEKIRRAKAIAPAQYIKNGFRLLYPKDPEASGTWIVLQENGSMAVLLNGGWQKHEPVYPYRSSRGVILLEIAASDDMADVFSRINLINIEPFTIILFQMGRLLECRWDGNKKYLQHLSAETPHIWSSVTLYDDDTIGRRKLWFSNWLNNHRDPLMTDITRFHLFGGTGDLHNDVRMNRDGQLLTVSITCIEINTDGASMVYQDLQDNSIFHSALTFIKVPETHS